MTTGLAIGEIIIQRIVEQEGPLFDAFTFFPTLTRELLDEHAAWLRPRYIDDRDRLVMCVQSYLVRTPHHTILVDTCVGNHKERPQRPFWHMMKSGRYERELARAGVGLDEIDYVMCTHLHGDHVGWNTVLENGRWVPTFPNARYLFARTEFDYWTSRHDEDPASVPWMTDSVLPIVAANRALVVGSDHMLGELVRLIPTPGHTIDHFSVRVGKPHEDAIITGDMIHTPLQARLPEMGMFSDHDSAQAGRTRRQLLGEISDTPTRLCTAHFPSPSTCRIIRKGDAFETVD